jgi:hypothetical protein
MLEIWKLIPSELIVGIPKWIAYCNCKTYMNKSLKSYTKLKEFIWYLYNTHKVVGNDH